VRAPAVSHFASGGDGPVFAGSLFPFLFITIACGALSGFHALISSGTTPKLLEKEGQMRLIGYGGMLTESFVAVMALISASILDQHLYFALNAPAAQTGGTAATAAEYVNHLGLTGTLATASELTDAAAGVGEKSIVSRTGGAPTLAVGMSEVLQRFLGGPGLKAFWYHFAIMFEALFILTAVDAGTRVARFMLSDALGNLGGPLRKLRNPSWRPGIWICSLVVAAAWGSILLMGVTDPMGGINTLFPLFGIANQLLAAIALTVVTVVVVKKGDLRWAWISGVPLLFDLVVTLTASWQKIFSADANVGYWTQHFQYAAAQASGKTSFGSAKTAEQLADVIRNTAIQGTLSVVVAGVVLIVVTTAIIVMVNVIRGDGLPLAEDDPVPSTMFAPSGLIATAGDRAVQRHWSTQSPCTWTADHRCSSTNSWQSHSHPGKWLRPALNRSSAASLTIERYATPRCLENERVENGRMTIGLGWCQ
jgi:carbon starvation protein